MDDEKRANHSIPRTQYALVIKHPRNLSFLVKLSHSFERKKRKKNLFRIQKNHLDNKKVFSFFLKTLLFVCSKQLHLRPKNRFWFVKKRTISPSHSVSHSFVSCCVLIRMQHRNFFFRIKETDQQGKIIRIVWTFNKQTASCENQESFKSEKNTKI